jgi:hypothetical protein
MKIILIRFFNPKKYLFSLLTVGCCIALLSKPAYSQIDYSYGANKTGFRYSIGLGGNTLQTTWTPSMGYTLLSSLGYDINNYFTVLAEGQYGLMGGVDGTNSYSFSKTVVNYYSGSINLRFSIGLLSDFESKNGFTDAIKRSYIGLGYGEIFSSVTLYQGNTSTTINKVVPGGSPPSNSSQYKSSGYTGVSMIPINIGTNIGMPGVWGADKVELNPNFQYSLFKDWLADGYRPQENSQKGGYGVLSISLRYKF